MEVRRVVVGRCVCGSGHGAFTRGFQEKHCDDEEEDDDDEYDDKNNKLNREQDELSLSFPLSLRLSLSNIYDKARQVFWSRSVLTAGCPAWSARECLRCSAAQRSTNTCSKM